MVSFPVVSNPFKWKTVVTALHKSTPLTLMHCRFVTVNQLFDLLRYCITISAGKHSWMCIFLSNDTNIFCISLSFPFLCHIFLFLYFFLFSSPFHPILLFPLFVHGSASLPHITLLVCLPSPSGPPHLTILTFFALPYKQFPHPHSPLPSLPYPTSSTLPSLPITQATVTSSPLQIPGPTAM